MFIPTLYRSYKFLFLTLWLFFCNPLYAGTPDGIISAATSVDATSATLNGLVNPNNESTTVTFDYIAGDFTGDDTGTSVNAQQSPLTGNGYQVVSAAITGLDPGTYYTVRVNSTNGTGTDQSTEINFTTSVALTATTDAANPVTNTTATLNGTINANNNSTTVTFEYGETTAYGTTVTADQSPVTGATDTAVSKAITGLTADTTYHYRVIGTNSVGTVNGDDMEFLTTTGLHTATTDAPEFSLTANTATLKGTVNAKNTSTTVTFEYGLTTAYGTTVTADESPVVGAVDTSVGKLISGLTPNTTYHYRVVATNGNGTVNGGDQTFFNTVAPSSTATAASSITGTTVTLNGIVNPKRFDDSNDTTVTFEYGLTTAYGSSIVAIQSPADGSTDVNVSALLTNLTANTTYHYRVVASNPNGTTNSDDITFTTLSTPVVSTLSASPVSTSGATLNGLVNSNNDSATVTFEYGTTTAYGSTVTADQSPVTSSSDSAVSKAISGLTNATTYHYRVVAVNTGGTSVGTDQTFITGSSPPSASTDAASSITTTGALLNGTVNANDLSTTVTFEYGETTAYGRVGNAFPDVVTGNSNTAVSLNLTSLTSNKTYHYRVVAQSAGGTVYGTDMSFTTPATPTVSTNTATAVTTTGATLNGTVNANNDSSTVTFEYGTTTSYGTTVTADQSPVTGANNNAVSKSITGLTPNTTYHYRVVGVNSSGTSHGTDNTFFTSAPASPTATTDAASSVVFNGATLNGTVNANNDSTVVTFEYGTTVAYGSTVTATQSPVTGATDTSVSKSITGLTGNTTYHYRVVGTNGNGTTNGTDLTFTTSALTPSAITTAPSSVGASFATLNGTANGNVAGATVTFEYGLTTAYGSSVSATPSSIPGDQADYTVSASITGLTNGTTYHYRVVADNAFVSPVNGSDMTFTTGTTPTVATDDVSSVTSNSATLNGTVNAQNKTTTVTFEYGTDTNYGKTVNADQSPVTGNTNTPVSLALSSLIPNTTYHYRAVVQTGIDTVVGNDKLFTTTSLSPTATTQAASSVGAAIATLNGLINANNDSTTVTFEYGTTTAYGTTVTADQSPVTGVTDTAVSKAISSLLINTTYHYRVVAQNGTGTTNGSDMTFTTGAVVPTVTTNAASSISTSGATLNATVNANSLSTTVTFEYGNDTSYGKSVTATQSPVTGSSDTAVSANITGIVQGTPVHFRVVASNAAGTSNGSDMTFTAGAPFVTTLAATSIFSSSATINGTVNANDDDTTVTFEYGLTTSYGSNQTATPASVSGSTDTPVSLGLSNLESSRTYHYRVIGQNSRGTTVGSDLTFNTLAPVIPAPSVTVNSSDTPTDSVTITSENQLVFDVSLSDKDPDSQSGIEFPFGVVSFKVSTTAGGSENVIITYSDVLPSTGFFLYKIDVTGQRTLIPNSLWQQQGNNSIKLTLTDGGPFDLDGIENGTIVDPIAVGIPTSDEFQTFELAPWQSVAFDRWITSDPVSISGISQALDVSISGGLFSINGGAYQSSSDSIGLGETLTIIVKSANSQLTSTSATITVGSFSTDFNVTTGSNEINQLLTHGNSCSSSAVDWVQKAYIAYYGRPADTGGLNYWSCEIDANGGELDSITDAFGNSREFTNQYAGLSNEQLINTVYQQLFSRNAEDKGLAYWLEQLESGNMPLINIALSILAGALNDDLTIVNNKLEVAKEFTNQTGASGVSIIDFYSILDTVTAEQSSVTTVKNSIPALVEAAVSEEASF